VWYHVGSGSEKVGRTGFAYLFEHVMFEGSKNVREGDFDNLLEAAGGNNNGSTNGDRTNYFETLPSNQLPLALFLESDRMGFLLDSLTQGKLDGQRDIVKNEKRQSYDNQPYGRAFPTISQAMYPAGHPYSWSTIGSMEDLNAASLDDVKEFFRKFYVPSNASLVIAGDVNPAAVRTQVEKWFADVPTGPAVVPPASPRQSLPAQKWETMEDKVQLPRVYMAWHSPRQLGPGDAECDLIATILAGGRSSRLYQKLVNELQIAQNVSASQSSAAQGSLFVITATAVPGVKLDQIESVIRAELAKFMAEAPSAREVQRALNQFEAGFLGQLESINGRADLLNSYYYLTQNPDWLNEDLNRYRGISPSDLQRLSGVLLAPEQSYTLSVVPAGKTELAVTPKK
jgi:zinc protease